MTSHSNCVVHSNFVATKDTKNKTHRKISLMEKKIEYLQVVSQN